MRRRFGSLALPLLAASLASGCIVDATFSPYGGTVTLDGAWQIDGVQADATSCTAAGISQIELVVLDSSVSNPLSYNVWNCADGSFDARTDASLPRLFHDTYYTQWFAWDAAGNQVGSSDPLLLDVSLVDHATLASPNFIPAAPPGFDPTLGGTVTLHGDWLINSKTADATTCAEVGLAQVQLHILEDGGTGDYTYHTWSCADGGFDGRTDSTLPMLAQGRYQTQWIALDASGTALGTSDPLLLDVSAVTDAGLASPDFLITPPAPGLDVSVSWDQDPTATMVDGTCAEAGVSDFFFSLDDASGTTVTDSNAVPGADAAGRIPCTESLSFTDLTAGTYSLYFDGAGAGGLKWMATCDMLVVDTGVAAYDCFVDQM